MMRRERKKLRGDEGGVVIGYEEIVVGGVGQERLVEVDGK